VALTLVTFTGTILQPDDVTPCHGKVVFVPAAGLLVSAADSRILAGDVTVTLDADGKFTVHLPSTDNEGIQPEPNTWNWSVRFKLSDAVIPSFSFALPASPGTTDLADVARVEPEPGTYLVIPGPQGLRGPKGDPGDVGDTGGALLAANNLADVDSAAEARAHLGLGTAATQSAGAFDVAGAASAAQAVATSVASADATTKANAAQAAAVTTAATDATTKANAAQSAATSAAAADANAKVTAHTGATDPHGDRAAATAALAAHEADSTGVHGIANTAALETSAGAAGKVTAHAGAADPHGDRAWAAGQFDAAGAASAAQTAAQGYAAAGDVTTLAAAKAYTDGHSGGGSPAPTESIRVTNDNLAGLPSAPAWTVVVTSGGTPLQCSISAAVGDRIRVDADFMYNGAHFLDWVMLDSAGAISVFSAANPLTPGTPLPEGKPSLYPSLSFSKVPGRPKFTVGPSHIDGAGKVTIGLAHQGTSTGLVYAHSTYPFEMEVENGRQ
jgi:hypothetical protein